MRKRTSSDVGKLSYQSINGLAFIVCLTLVCGLAVVPVSASTVDTKSTFQLSSLPGENSKEISYSGLPNITAELVKYNEREPSVVESNWLQLSPQGMRVRDVNSGSQIIKNFDQQRVWLVNKKNNTSHEINVEFFRAMHPEQLPYLLGAESLSNISGTKPCADLQGRNNGKRYWRGQFVHEWDCLSDKKELLNTQLFSKRWNIVVQVKHADLRVEELVNIREKIPTAKTFLPDKALVHVDLSEFMTGRRQLESYSP